MCVCVCVCTLIQASPRTHGGKSASPNIDPDGSSPVQVLQKCCVVVNVAAGVSQDGDHAQPLVMLEPSETS